jgi:hypothetical protein
VWQGRSFAKGLSGGGKLGRDELVLSMMAWSCQRAVRWGDWLLMRVYDDGLKAVPEVMLFDVARDPHELRDLAGQRPEVVNEGLARLERWTQDQLAASPDRVDPLQIVQAEGGPYHTRDDLKPYCQRLRETGRAKCAEELEAKAARRRSAAGYSDPASA